MGRRWVLVYLAVVVAAACSRAQPRSPAAQPMVGGSGSQGSSSIVGVASWYGPGFDGKRTSTGEIYNQEDLTAASNVIALGTQVMVTNLKNGRSVQVRINDHGPFLKGRKIDLSHRAAQILGIVNPGTARVRIDILSPGVLAHETPGYFVQVGAFTSSTKASHLKGRLSQTFSDVHIQELDSGAHHYYRVRMGEFATREEAHARAEQSAGMGLNAIIVSR